MTTPPHLRPSAPVGPTGQPIVAALRPLNENEARLAREKGQTHAEYLAWIAEPSESVATSMIGKGGTA